MMDRSRYQGEHILAAGITLGTDTWQTGINNKILIFGPSGAGKSRGYVEPNIRNCSNESIIVSNTKGEQEAKHREDLLRKGYKVLKIDFTDLSAGCGYNPMDYIRYDPKTDLYNEQDIISLCMCLVPDTGSNDPYWEQAARQYLACLIAYVLEALPEEEHTLESVVKLVERLGDQEFDMLVRELSAFKPDSTIPGRYEAIRGVSDSPKTDASVKAVLSTALDTLRFDTALALYKKPQKIDLSMFGREKTALFITISDTDRSLDKLANALMTQILQILCRSADHDYENHYLDIPVRMYLDDFATNLYIPNFDNIISVIRSREIYVSVILQSITQLEALYGEAKAKTIINNCDQQLYLGGQDIDTARFVSERANRNLSTILSLPIGHGFLFIRGEKPRPIISYAR